jgi:hypothetical protein
MPYREFFTFNFKKSFLEEKDKTNDFDLLSPFFS